MWGSKLHPLAHTLIQRGREKLALARISGFMLNVSKGRYVMLLPHYNQDIDIHMAEPWTVAIIRRYEFS
jgi:hypothetical protein